MSTKYDEIEARQAVMIGDYAARVDYTLGALDEQGFVRRLWDRDVSLWRQGPDGEKVIKNRLGWLDVVSAMTGLADEIAGFAEEVRSAGFTHAVLAGMGGSSLSPEVSRLTFGVKEGYPDLMVLDSTVPAAVLEAERRIDPAKTLFIISTKSGATVETLSAMKYFYEKVKSGANFVAITDPGSSLQEAARALGFRRVFTNFPDIGGRYSALSYFGLVPAAVIGADIKPILERAAEMVSDSAADVPPADNPSVTLGAIMAELAQEGRNKLTLITSPELRSFGYWVEQLVAESTGKNGTGVIPVESEPLASPEQYGDDRLFVYLRLANSPNPELDARVQAIEESGQPLVAIRLDDVYDLGREYFRWELATGVASAILGVNAFDEPNVKESKDNTGGLLAEFREKGRLPESEPVLTEDGVSLYCDEETRGVLDRIRASEPHRDRSLLSYIAAHLDEFQPGNYFGLMAFVQPTREVEDAFSCMRAHLVSAYSAATTLGYGPRFLHSTGQLHKGGPNTGVFIQFTADDPEDAPIPGEPFSFSILKQAQAMGDAAALRDKGRPLIRIHLGKDPAADLNRVLDLVHEAVKEQPDIGTSPRLG